MMKADVVVCGAGIAGISAAYHLAVCRGIKRVVLVDPRPPLSLTSDKSTECYRNWWPGPGNAMVAFVNRSIDILEQLAEESQNVFRLNRRGYLYAVTRDEHVEELRRRAASIAELGAGPLRMHAAQDDAYRPPEPQGFEDQPLGADLLLEPALIRRYFPYLSAKTATALHARRCGWLSAQQLGMLLLERARQAGTTLLPGAVEDVALSGGRCQGVQVRTPSGVERIATQVFVNAAGPFLRRVGRLMDIEIPVYCELHAKAVFRDTLGVVARHSPLLILDEPQRLAWSAEEKNELAEEETLRWLLNPLPAGVHVRPEGGADSPWVVMLWPYHTPVEEPREELSFDPLYPEIVLRGLVRLLPGMQHYLAKIPKAGVDGGYYTRTQENRPLIGPLPIEGTFVIGALSGFGIMAACAAGELLAAHVCGGELPPYACWFHPARYEEPEYCALLKKWDAGGQL